MSFKDLLAWCLSPSAEPPAPQPVRAAAEAEATDLMIDRVVVAATLRLGYRLEEIDELRAEVRRFMAEVRDELRQLRDERDGAIEAAAALAGRDGILPFAPADAACAEPAKSRGFHLRTH